MFRFRRWDGRGEGGMPFRPVAPGDSDDVLRRRVGQLKGDDYEIYKWMREFYSERWIAETLLLPPRAVREKIRAVYFSLGVRGKKAFLRTYGRLERPQKGPVDTEEIDSYIDARTEKEIRRDLDGTKT